MPRFAVLQIERVGGRLVAGIHGSADGAPLTAIRAAAPTSIEVVDAAAYMIVATGVPSTAALNAPFSFQVGWSQIGPTSDPFPASPIAVAVEGVQFTYTPDQATHQTTVTITPSVAGPLQIRVGEQSFTVEVS